MFEKRDFESVGGRKTVIVLCIDTSNSVFRYQKQINIAVRAFLDELEMSSEARFGTEVAIVTYDTIPRLHCDFSADKSLIRNKPVVIPKNNESGGWTDMGAALEYAITLVKKRVSKIKNSGSHVYVPWIFLFTDGKPENKTKDADVKMEKAIRELQKYEIPYVSHDKIYYVGVGVGDKVNVSLMKRISAHGSARYIHTNDFSKLSTVFKFLSATTVTISEKQQHVVQEIPEQVETKNSSNDSSLDVTESIMMQSPDDDNGIMQILLDSESSGDFDPIFINQRLDISPVFDPEPTMRETTVNGTVIADPNPIYETQNSRYESLYENAKKHRDD